MSVAESVEMVIAISFNDAFQPHMQIGRESPTLSVILQWLFVKFITYFEGTVLVSKFDHSKEDPAMKVTIPTNARSNPSSSEYHVADQFSLQQ